MLCSNKKALPASQVLSTSGQHLPTFFFDRTHWGVPVWSIHVFYPNPCIPPVRNQEPRKKRDLEFLNSMRKRTKLGKYHCRHLAVWWDSRSPIPRSLIWYTSRIQSNLKKQSFRFKLLLMLKTVLTSLPHSFGTYSIERVHRTPKLVYVKKLRYCLKITSY